MPLLYDTLLLLLATAAQVWAAMRRQWPAAAWAASAEVQ